LKPVAAMPNLRRVRHYHLRWFSDSRRFPPGKKSTAAQKFVSQLKQTCALFYFDAEMRFSLQTNCTEDAHTKDGAGLPWSKGKMGRVCVMAEFKTAA
jgi:hypothetical protein